MVDTPRALIETHGEAYLLRLIARIGGLSRRHAACWR
jgi:hypothetical protein